MRKVGNLKEHLKDNKLNVIVKIQSYELKAGETYEGQFHQEGLNKEGIFMVAIYYFHISPNLKGGDLELKFAKNNKTETNKFQIQENSVAIFLNQRCEHRISLLETYLPKPGKVYERKILAFFIADPQNSTIPTSKNLQLNQKALNDEKDLMYAKRDGFKKARLVFTNDELDYGENDEFSKKILKEVEEFKQKGEDLNLNKSDIKKTNQKTNVSFPITIGTTGGKFCSVYVSDDTTVEQTMKIYFETNGIQPNRIMLCFGGKILNDQSLLANYGVKEGSTLMILPFPRKLD